VTAHELDLLHALAWVSSLTTTKGREHSKVSQVKNYSFLSTLTPTYWPSDESKFPDLLDFFVTNGTSSTFSDKQSSYDVTSEHSSITAILSTTLIHRKPTPRLHNSKNWDTYRQIIQDNVNLSINVKEHEDIEL